MIYNEMIQKSNGFNPFLTDMNYKITFRTWLRFARQRIRMEEQGKDFRRMSLAQRMRDAMIKTYDVEIEMQREEEWTSEEDEDMYSSFNSKKLGKSLTLGGGGIEGLKRSRLRNLDLSGRGQNSFDPMEPRRKTDHLVQFERQMQNKLKSMMSLKQMNNSSSKSNGKVKVSQSLKNTPLKLQTLTPKDKILGTGEKKQFNTDVKTMHSAMRNKLLKKIQTANESVILKS